MLKLMCAMGLSSGVSSGVVHLHGESSMIRFGDDAILAASCLQGPVTVLYFTVPTRPDLVATETDSVKAYLSNVRWSCASITSIKEPCATALHHLASDSLLISPGSLLLRLDHWRSVYCSHWPRQRHP